MDIGSIFPLDNHYFEPLNNINGYEVKWKNRYALCREAIYQIAESMMETNRIVLIPAYTCSTVYDPFIQLGWQCVYYGINMDLSIDVNDLKEKFDKSHAAICMVHPFHGMPFSDMEVTAIESIRQGGCVIVKDVTQAIFDEGDDGWDYLVGSLRKWFPIPDGGFLIDKKDELHCESTQEFSRFTQNQVDAMYLRNQYFENKDERVKTISIRLNKEAVALSYNRIEAHMMSAFSDNILGGEELTKIQEARLSNYVYLYRHLPQNGEIRFVNMDIDRVKTAPLYFPIYCTERSKIQKQLAQKHIYAPVLWPVGVSDVLINDTTRYIYDHILVIPIDQRYTEQDMQFICDVLSSEMLE